MKLAHVTLKENEKLIREEYNIANTFNKFFKEIVPKLGIKIEEKQLHGAESISDPIKKAIQKF